MDARRAAEEFAALAGSERKVPYTHSACQDDVDTNVA
jgi:hypothetical protein